MKIVVDTKEDNVQDIKDTIKMLQALVEARAGVTNPDSGIMSMFGDTPQNPPPDPQAMSTLFADETLPEKDAKDVPKVEIIDY